MIKAITIDCWDTILENNRAWDPIFVEHARRVFARLDSSCSWETVGMAFRREGRQFSETLAKHMVTLPILDRLKNLGRAAHIDLSDGALEDLRQSFEATIFSPAPQLVNGVEEFLTRARSAHKKVGLVCNTGWFSGRAISGALQQYKLDSLIDFSVFSDQVGHAKPSPRIFEAALAYAGCLACECIHIGDSLSKDVQGALAAGQHAMHLHPHGRCVEGNVLCASNYKEVWSLLTSQLGLQG